MKTTYFSTTNKRVVYWILIKYPSFFKKFDVLLKRNIASEDLMKFLIFNPPYFYSNKTN